MSDPTNEPSRKQIREPTNDQMNDQTTHEMNEQTEVLLKQSGTHANVSQQLVHAANSEGSKVKSMKTAQRAIGSMCKSFQSRGPCKDKNSEQVGNGASTQSRGLCHGKKSEQAGCIAFAQMRGLCHGKKSERAGCIASA